MKVEFANEGSGENKIQEKPKTLVILNKTKAAYCLPSQDGDLEGLLEGEEAGKFLTPGENTVSVELWRRLTEENYPPAPSGQKPKKKNKGIIIAMRKGNLEVARAGEAYPLNLSWASRPIAEFEAFLAQIKTIDKVDKVKEGLEGHTKLLALCEKRIDAILDEAQKVAVDA